VARPVAPVRQSQRLMNGTARRHPRPWRRVPPPRGTRFFIRVVLASLTTLVFVVGWSLGHALTMQGGGTVSERVAEWARTHYLSPLVTFGEWLTYSPPKKGGKPNIAFNKQGGQIVHKRKHYHGLVPIIPDNLTPMAGHPLPGEGIWREVEAVKGKPAVFKTYLRFSSVYTSYYAGLVSMDQRLLRFSLRPGTEDPGPGNWGASDYIASGGRTGLIATFNSGFRIYASGGGFYLHGHYQGALVKGVASEVYYKNGRLAIGTWGRGGLHMGPNVAAVRQNLRLIVVGGKVPAAVDQNVLSSWGATLGGGYYVWRSGVCVTKDKRIIYAYGPALNVRELADVLRRAGCQTGMELDINPDWMSFMYYLAKNHPANPTPVNLLPTQVQPADRYYFPANRDFTAVFAR
jgi:hypothetical protein